MVSETSKIRHMVLPYVKGMGVDLGYGGDPIVPSAITMDLKNPYNLVGEHPQNLWGDAHILYWFKDGVLDYVYSSHLLEDFYDTTLVLKEWLRVIKDHGVLILYLPNEKKYREVCKKTGQGYNYHHKYLDMSLEYIKKSLLDTRVITTTLLEYQESGENEYSFLIIVRKEEVS